MRARLRRDCVELKGKAQISKDRYDEIMESPLIQCVQSCVEEKESEGVMPVLSDEDLQSFEVAFPSPIQDRSPRRTWRSAAPSPSS